MINAEILKEDNLLFAEILITCWKGRFYLLEAVLPSIG